MCSIFQVVFKQDIDVTALAFVETLGDTEESKNIAIEQARLALANSYDKVSAHLITHSINSYYSDVYIKLTDYIKV